MNTINPSSARLISSQHPLVKAPTPRASRGGLGLSDRHRLISGVARLLLVGVLLSQTVWPADMLGWANLRAEECQICRQNHATIGLELEGNGPRYAPDRVVDVLHIKLDVTPDFARHTVQGTASLTVRPISQPVKELKLDGMDLNVSQVTADVPVAEFTTTRTQVVVEFTEAIPVGREITLHITYSAEPHQGLYFRTPDMGYPASDTHIWTQGEAHEARYWFPCFDYPNERSTTEIICHVPHDMIVLSNGQKMSDEVDAAKQIRTVRWLQDKPHVNYLICLVAGYFEKLSDQHRDIPLGFYVQPSLAAHASNSFQDTRQIMEFFESEIGVPFPWNKYDQVTILDFVAGGMENTTLTTLTHQTIFSADTENIRSSRSLDAHEMAHQWFGDYVTCKDWSHLWLNEGFATYYTHLYEGHKLGHDAMLYGLYEDAQRQILTQENDRRPIAYRGYKDAAEQFDYRAYPKGSWVLHMLRSQLGVDLYRRAIKTYLERHALGNVTSDDLRQVFEELSGKPLDRFFDQWVYHARFPNLSIRYEWLTDKNQAHLTVNQTQEINQDVLMFELPTKFRFVLADGSVVDYPVTLDQAEQEFFVPLASQPQVVRFDPDYTLLAKISFDLPETMLLAQLDQANDMMGRLEAVQALGRMKSKQAIERLGKSLREDAFFGVRLQAADALAGIDQELAYQELSQSTVQSDARVRQRVLEALGRNYRPETEKKLLEQLAQEKNPAIRASCVRALAKFDSPETRRAILDALRSDTFEQELADAALQALADRNDASLLPPLLRTIRSRSEQLPTSVVARALSTAGKLGRQHEDRSAVRELLASYVLDPRAGVQLSAVRALGQLGDERAEPILRSLADQESRRLARTATEALSKINEQTPLAPTEVSELRRSLRELQEAHERLQKKVDQLQAPKP